MSTTPPASQPQRKTQECFKCKNAGAPGVQIYFDGKDANDQWIFKNPDGSVHVHKEKARGSGNGPKPQYDIDYFYLMPISKMDEIKKLQSQGFKIVEITKYIAGTFPEPTMMLATFRKREGGA